MTTWKRFSQTTDVSVQTCLNCTTWTFVQLAGFLLSLNRQEIKHQEVGIRYQLFTFTAHRMLTDASKRLVYRREGGKKAPRKCARPKGGNDAGTSERRNLASPSCLSASACS